MISQAVEHKMMQLLLGGGCPGKHGSDPQFHLLARRAFDTLTWPNSHLKYFSQRSVQSLPLLTATSCWPTFPLCWALRFTCASGIVGVIGWANSSLRAVVKIFFKGLFLHSLSNPLYLQMFQLLLVNLGMKYLFNLRFLDYQ